VASATSPPRPDQRLPEALVYSDIEEVSWRAAAPEFIEAWEQAEQLVLLGKTGRGKTTFAVDVLDRRHKQRHASVCSFVTKKRDETSEKLIAKGWNRITTWPPTYAQRKAGKMILWPPYTRASTYPRDVRPVFLDALDEIMEEGNWTLYLDEAGYIVESLKLRTSMDELFTQSRSNGITLMAGSQRPVWVSRAMLSQHAWVCAFRIGDTEDAKRAAEVMGDRDRYAPVLSSLGPHQFLLVDTLGDNAVVSEIGS
jgi:Cdc6-like AAA superfamily ATPase